MEIIDEGLEFNSNYETRDISVINRIILHHTGVSVEQSVEVIHNYHKSIGYAGIGYHFYVRKDGLIYKGRDIDMVGAHAYGSNYDSIGVCAEGNFNEEEMNDTQKSSLKELVSYLKATYGIDLVQAHRDVDSTSCPGDNYPFEEIANSEPQPTPPEPPTPSGDEQIRAIQEWCNSYGLDINVDGYYGYQTKNAITKVYQIELNAQFGAGLDVDGIFGQDTYNATPIVRYGAEGNITKAIQSILYCRGYDTDGVDGLYYDGTEKAIRTFQANHGLSKDGVYGPNTGYALFN